MNFPRARPANRCLCVRVFAGTCKHMPLSQIAVRVDDRLKRAVDEACRAHGVKLTRFVQDALLDKLEEIADAEDLPRLRREPTRPLRDLIRDLGLDGDV